MEKNEKVEELPDEWWYRVYLAVIITTVIVITALGTFHQIFFKLNKNEIFRLGSRCRLFGLRHLGRDSDD